MLSGISELALTIDEPGRHLKLVNTQPELAPVQQRAGCLLVVLVAAIGLILVVFYSIGIDNVANIAAAVGWSLLIVFMSVVVIRGALFPPRQLLLLELKRGHDVVAEWGLQGTDSVERLQISPERLTVVDASVESGGSGRGGSGLEIQLRISERDGEVWLSNTIRVRGLDRDEELLDLLSRMGAILGIRHHRVVARDPKRLVIRVGGDAEGDSLPVPQSPSDYVNDRYAEGLKMADEVLPELDPSRALPSNLAVVEWEPARRLVVARRFRILDRGLCLVLMLVSVTGLVLWFAPDRVPGGTAVIEEAGAWWGRQGYGPDGGITFIRAVLLVTSTIGVIAAWLIGQRLFDRLEVDATRGFIAARFGFRERRTPVSDVASVSLVRRVSSGRNEHGASTGSRYSLEVRAVLKDDRSVPLVRTYSTNYTGCERNYESLYPLTVALATALGVPHRYE